MVHFKEVYTYIYTKRSGLSPFQTFHGLLSKSLTNVRSPKIPQSTTPLVDRQFVRIKVIQPRINRSLIINTLHTRPIPTPERPQRPPTNLRTLPLALPRQIRSIQRDRLNPLLDPVNHHRQVRLGERPVRLIRIGGTMGRAGDEEEFIPRVELGTGLVVGQRRVHDASHGLVVAHRRGGGDGIV